MTNMIERAAKALAAYDLADWEAKTFLDTPGGEEPSDMRDGYMEKARAVIDSLRGPDKKVMLSTHKKYGKGIGCMACDPFVFHDFIAAYIDAALEET